MISNSIYEWKVHFSFPLHPFLIIAVWFVFNAMATFSAISHRRHGWAERTVECAGVDNGKKCVYIPWRMLERISIWLSFPPDTEKGIISRKTCNDIYASIRADPLASAPTLNANGNKKSLLIWNDTWIFLTRYVNRLQPPAHVYSRKHICIGTRKKAWQPVLYSHCSKI